MPKEIKKKCPLVGEECWGHECEWYQQIRGTHPQTGEPIDEYMCAMLWQNILLIENSQQQRQTGAAVESFRNELTTGVGNMVALAKQNMNYKLKNSETDPRLVDDSDE